MKELSEYEQQAKDFLEEAGASIEFTFTGIVQGFPDEEENSIHRRPHRSYDVTIRRGNKSWTTKFYGSFDDCRSGKDPDADTFAYDFLACLNKYPVYGDEWDFADEFGYTINSRSSFERVRKIREGCIKEYEALLNLFGEELMEKLTEIS